MWIIQLLHVVNINKSFHLVMKLKKKHHVNYRRHNDDTRDLKHRK